MVRKVVLDRVLDRVLGMVLDRVPDTALDTARGVGDDCREVDTLQGGRN